LADLDTPDPSIDMVWRIEVQKIQFLTEFDAAIRRISAYPKSYAFSVTGSFNGKI